MKCALPTLNPSPVFCFMHMITYKINSAGHTPVQHDMVVRTVTA